MKRRDIPLQMICLCNENGSISPVRFKFEDEDANSHVCRVVRVINVKHSELAGIDALLYQCAVQSENKTATVWLRYTVMSRKWMLLGSEEENYVS